MAAITRDPGAAEDFFAKAAATAPTPPTFFFAGALLLVGVAAVRPMTRFLAGRGGAGDGTVDLGVLGEVLEATEARVLAAVAARAAALMVAADGLVEGRCRFRVSSLRTTG